MWSKQVGGCIIICWSDDRRKECHCVAEKKHDMQETTLLWLENVIRIALLFSPRTSVTVSPFSQVLLGISHKGPKIPCHFPETLLTHYWRAAGVAQGKGQVSASIQGQVAAAHPTHRHWWKCSPGKVWCHGKSMVCNLRWLLINRRSSANRLPVLAEDDPALFLQKGTCAGFLVFKRMCRIIRIRVTTRDK